MENSCYSCSWVLNSSIPYSYLFQQAQPSVYRSCPQWISSSHLATWLPSSNNWKPACTEMSGWKTNRGKRVARRRWKKQVKNLPKTLASRMNLVQFSGCCSSWKKEQLVSNQIILMKAHSIGLTNKSLRTSLSYWGQGYYNSKQDFADTQTFQIRGCGLMLSIAQTTGLVLV